MASDHRSQIDFLPPSPTLAIDGPGIADRNNQRFIFDIGLQTWKDPSIKPDDEGERKNSAIRLNPNAIINLTIEDDLLSWFAKGYMIYQNNLEGVEAESFHAAAEFSESFRTILENIEPNQNNPTFRMDGRDLLIIKIMPIMYNETNFVMERNNIFKPEQWSLEYEFVIYDTEDIPTDNPIVKYKKIYFRDLRQQIMSEINSDFSTTKSSKEKDGTLSTSEALSAVLERANSFYGLGKVSKTEWDSGNNPIFYTSPSQYTVIDDINYILDRHVSAPPENDTCLFTNDRYTKEFQLIPFSKIFKKSTGETGTPGEYQIEHFFLQTFADNNQPTTFRAPLKLENDPAIDTKLNSYNIITQYRFVDMAGADNAKALTSRPVYSYDFKNGTFRIESKENNIISAKDYFTKNYVGGLYGSAKSPIFTMNKIKTEFLNITPEYSTKATAAQRLNDGRNKTLWAAIYLNECLSFNVLGMTNRKAGRFIGIDKMEGENKSDFDSKFLGQWFTTNIRHVFTRDSYINEILAIKIHSWQDLKINESIP